MGEEEERKGKRNTSSKEKESTRKERGKTLWILRESYLHCSELNVNMATTDPRANIKARIITSLFNTRGDDGQRNYTSLIQR